MNTIEEEVLDQDRKRMVLEGETILQDHASQVYNISSNRNFKRNSLNPAQIEKTISKYQQLSKDAQSAGDPILSENYLQHADHYSRKLSEINLKSDKPQSLNQNIKAEKIS